MVALWGCVYKSVLVTRSGDTASEALVGPSGPSLAVFERNCDALYDTQPSLVQRLSRVLPMSLEAARNGEPTCRFSSDGATRWLHSAYEPTSEARRLAALVPPSETAVLLVGAGLGYVVAELVQSRPDVRVVVLEPEQRFLRTMLSLFDLSQSIRARRVLFTAGRETDLAVRAHLPESPFLLRHPALAKPYADALRHYRFLARLGNERGRVIVIDYKLFVADLTREFEHEGFAVRTVEATGLTVESFDELCGSVRPSCVISINYSPAVACIATRKGLPYVSWTVDPLPKSRLTALHGTDFALCLAYAHRPLLLAELAAVGVPEPRFLPLAAGSLRATIADDARLAELRCNVSFAGVSLRVEYDAFLQRLAQLGGTEALRARVERWLHDTFRMRGGDIGFVGIATDGSELPEWLAPELAPSADPVELSDRINGALSHLLRMRRIESLQPLGVRVYGDDGWEVLGAAYLGRAEHGDELSRVYCASAVNLDVPRLYQRDIVTMRVCDVLACGGVLLTEPSEQLAEMFMDGVHLYTYRDEAELEAKVRHILANPAEARLVAERGRELVMREHLFEHRVRTILDEMTRRGWITR
ncbi:MAG: glycosyltransferase family 1 protein [Myxococcales bacterium]|nr:glycosyltransferase family 1 protein [Myxococcales bacterium]